MTPNELLATLGPLARHTLMLSAGWDTKQHCKCGADFASRAEFWKHQADQYDALVNAWPDIAARLERLAAAEADADQLAAELSQHGYGDFHYTGPDYRDKSVLEALRLHDEAVARRSQP